jgi:hypothetical protein
MISAHTTLFNCLIVTFDKIANEIWGRIESIARGKASAKFLGFFQD